MAEQPSRQVLDGIAARVLTFLIAVGKYFAIRAALSTRGYTEADHELAWGLLKTLAVFPPGSAATVDKTVRDAIVAIDAWDEPNFAVIRAVLENRHPEVVDFVFENLSPKQGAEAVVGVSTLLDRLDAMENAPERLSTRSADHAALATLATRGYSAGERARLRGLVTMAQTLTEVAPISAEEREATLQRLYAWHNEWSAIARMVLVRRDHQIVIGIAKRRKAKKAEASAEKPAVPAAKPAVPAVMPAGRVEKQGGA
jgi:hypothetical protein